MTRRSAQDVSMMMDNELERDEIHDLVQHLRNDEQLKSCWEAYHLIGDTLRKNLPPFVLPDLTSRVSAAIQNEPSYFLPQQAAQSESVPRHRAAWSFALAASVTALAVVGMMQFNRPVSAPLQQSLAVATLDAPHSAQVEKKIPAVVHPVVYASVTTEADGGSRLINTAYDNEAGVDYPGEAADLYDYLVNYQKYAQTVSLQGGFYPAVQLVGYSPQ